MSAAATATTPAVARSSSRRQSSHNTAERSSQQRTPSTSRHSTAPSEHHRSPSLPASHARGPSMSQQANLAGVARRDYEQTNIAQSQSTRRSASRDGHNASSMATRAESSRGAHRTDSRQGQSQYSSDVPRGASSGYSNQQHAASSRKSRGSLTTKLGTWTIGKTIGAGSMGKVKLATNVQTHQQAAVKIVPRASTEKHKDEHEKARADHSKEARTAREAAICTLLEHKYISKLYDYTTTNSSWCMLFEYINGGQMLDYIISHGKLKEKQARKFARQIASALDYCHRNSIVHRDLKIENILISKEGDIKIIDFGLSNLFEPKGHLKTFCGSLYFAAPELLNAKQYTGPEVDVWSFGIVLYVLVCGKVPFDDQSMPALHDKIKKGSVEYPSSITSECKNLISKMLTKDPRQRATLADVMSHQWMMKGYGPIENFLPTREPLQLPLDDRVINEMDGFGFGSVERIRDDLTRVIDSDEYQNAVNAMSREMSASTPGHERKRGLFEMYKRRNSTTSRETLSNMSVEAINSGADPVNAYHPLISVYYLAREKLERDMTADGLDGTSKTRAPTERPDITPELAAPPAAYTNSNTYEIPGEKPSGGRSRPRARTHGEDDIPDAVKKQHQGRSSDRVSPAVVAHPAPQQATAKKESMAGGLLRRFSTRRGREPSRNETNAPPALNLQPPTDGTPAPRRGLSIRKSRKDPSTAPMIHSAGSQPQHGSLLSPSKLLGRSTSVSSADRRRRQAQYDGSGALVSPFTEEPPLTSGSDRQGANGPKVKIHEPPTPSSESKPSISRSASSRTKSLGHARRESIQARRARRGDPRQVHVPEETDEEIAAGEATDGESQAEIKPVFLKGLFSVSTTSSKPLSIIRADLVRVFKQMGVEYTDIKGGFSCRHAPSIDLGRNQDTPASPDRQGFSPTHRRRISFHGFKGADRERDDAERTPRTPTRRRGPDASFTNSEESDDDRTMKNRGATDRTAGETSTHVQSDMGENLILRFEVFIVKVPLFSLHGIQFKKVSGGTWQYKNMAQKILDALRL